MGLLLIFYSTLSLWLGASTSNASPARANYCEWFICSQTNNDSPGFITPSSDKPLTQAQSELLHDPASAYRWMDLADAEVNSRHIDSGLFCVRQALASAPGNPSILLRASSLYLRLEDYPATLHNLMSVLRNPDLADYYDQVFTRYSNMDLPLHQLLDEGTPKTPQAANSFLRFWIDQNRLDEAHETWDWITKNSLFSLQTAGSYVALLAKDSRWDDALKSWSNSTSQMDAAYTKKNWVFNGSFESKPVDCPFDWHWTSSDGVQIVRDDENGYMGSASLRLRFRAVPIGMDAKAYQTVLLTPGNWILKATMKTQDLTGDKGVIIRVVDAEDPSRLDESTNTFHRSQEWTGVSKAFNVGPKTHRALVEIFHPASQTSPLTVSGTAWVDGVQLIPQP